MVSTSSIELRAIWDPDSHPLYLQHQFPHKAAARPAVSVAGSPVAVAAAVAEEDGETEKIDMRYEILDISWRTK